MSKTKRRNLMYVWREWEYLSFLLRFVSPHEREEEMEQNNIGGKISKTIKFMSFENIICMWKILRFSVWIDCLFTCSISVGSNSSVCGMWTQHHVIAHCISLALRCYWPEKIYCILVRYRIRNSAASLIDTDSFSRVISHSSFLAIFRFSLPLPLFDYAPVTLFWASPVLSRKFFWCRDFIPNLPATTMMFLEAALLHFGHIPSKLLYSMVIEWHKIQQRRRQKMKATKILSKKKTNNIYQSMIIMIFILHNKKLQYGKFEQKWRKSCQISEYPIRQKTSIKPMKLCGSILRFVLYSEQHYFFLCWTIRTNQ